MNPCLRWLRAAALVLAAGNLSAEPLDFTGFPITCIDPAGATVPTPCAGTTAPRSDGYSLIGYSFNILIPPPPPGGPPPPFPMVVQNDSMRDFLNPVMQDLVVWIFGDTKVDVDGAPVTFFVDGTLDGAVVTSFSQVVSGHDNHMSWSFAGVVDDVPAGVHTLDMHFGVIQMVPNQQSQVNVASLYRVTANAAPEPATVVLLALGLAGLAAARRRRQ